MALFLLGLRFSQLQRDDVLVAGVDLIEKVFELRVEFDVEENHLVRAKTEGAVKGEGIGYRSDICLRYVVADRSKIVRSWRFGVIEFISCRQVNGNPSASVHGKSR